MIFIYILLIGLGVVPLVLILRRMSRANHLKKNGHRAMARVRDIHAQQFNKTTMDMLQLEYQDESGKYYYGTATSTTGKHKINDELKVYYDKTDPSKMAVSGAELYIPVLIFCILLLLFVIFAAYKISGLMEGTNFKFKGF